jgi:hypothetical protein
MIGEVSARLPHVPHRLSGQVLRHGVRQDQ